MAQAEVVELMQDEEDILRYQEVKGKAPRHLREEEITIKCK
jgi:chromosome condensin MukBEF complex kleisin-like MukF subunit